MTDKPMREISIEGCELIGKGGTLTLVKGTAEGESEISAITGASVTSGAVTEALNAGLELYDTVLKGGN